MRLVLQAVIFLIFRGAVVARREDNKKNRARTGQF